MRQISNSLHETREKKFADFRTFLSLSRTTEQFSLFLSSFICFISLWLGKQFGHRYPSLWASSLRADGYSSCPRSFRTPVWVCNNLSWNWFFVRMSCFQTRNNAWSCWRLVLISTMVKHCLDSCMTFWFATIISDLLVIFYCSNNILICNMLMVSLCKSNELVPFFCLFALTRLASWTSSLESEAVLTAKIQEAAPL